MNAVTASRGPLAHTGGNQTGTKRVGSKRTGAKRAGNKRSSAGSNTGVV